MQFKKKYWKVKTDNLNFRQSLEFINVPESYIKILEKNCLIETKYIFITYHKKSTEDYCDFCWCDIDEINWLRAHDFKYYGEINLRKDKLKKLNGSKNLENKE